MGSLRNRKRWVAAFLSAALLAAGWVLVGPRELGGPLALVSTYGDSMLPAYEPSDLVVIRAAANVDVGDVVAYHSDKLDTTVLHRIVGHDGDRLVLSGDNNDWVDPDRPRPDDVIGRAWLTVPSAGRLLEQPPAVRAALALAAVAAVAALLGALRRRRPRANPTPPRRTASLTAPRTPLQWTRPALMASVATLVICGALAAAAFTNPVNEPGPVGYTHHGEFTYRADAPRGPVYPDGEVTTGDVVYRRLVDQLDVTFTYHLAPDADAEVSGQVELAAEVADGSGWTRTIPTDATATIEDGEATLEATIDIQRMQGRIDAFAEAAGVPSTSKTLTLAPTVTIEGTLAGVPLSDEFAPTLSFRLDELTLQPEQPTASQEDDDPASPTRHGDVSAPDTEPATLALLGRDLEVGTARRVSTAGGGAALLATLALGGMLAFTPRQDAHSRAHARHRRLILPAERVDLAPGHTVVDVADLDALAGLAQHHQSVILHQQHHDADLYLLEHRNTTYRFHATPSGDDPHRGTPDSEAPSSLRSAA